MNIFAFSLQVLWIAYCFQYIIVIESSAEVTVGFSLSSTQQLWDNYFSIYNHQLDHVFHSQSTLTEAHSFENVHNKNPYSLSYGCCSYRHGQNLAFQYRNQRSPSDDVPQSMLPIVVDKANDQMCFLLINQTKNDHGEYLINTKDEFDFYIDSSSSLKLHPSIYELIEKPYELETAFVSTDITIYYRTEYFQDYQDDSTDYQDDSTEQLLVSYIAQQILPDLLAPATIFEDMFWAAESTQLFFETQLLLQPPDDHDNNNQHSSKNNEDLLKDYQRAITWYEIASYFKESEDTFETCNFNEIMKTTIIEKGTIVISVASLKSNANIPAPVAVGCIAYIASYFAQQPFVNFIAMTSKVELFNFRARSIQQSAVASATATASPYTAAGLTGVGQIISIADSGVDVTNCYFSDMLRGSVPPSLLTSPFYNTSYRKVIQYNYNGCGDTSDEVAGHGTHVSGTAVGSIFNADITTIGKFGGVAPDGKLSFVDLGKPGTGLCIPSANELYTPGRKAGARIASNSWGGYYTGPSYYSTGDTDNYLYKYTNTAIFFAAGNAGQNGGQTLTMQATGKNSISVGSSESTLGGPNITNVAFYSSQGPTYDNRIKPDIVAPGDSLNSALSNGNAGPSCGITNKLGTSMSTPAAAGNALLIRQYFVSTNRTFWIGNCNSVYTFCKSFNPTGVLTKAIILHSGAPMYQYHGPPNVILGSPPDMIQGYGRVKLSNVLPLLGLYQFDLFVEDLRSISEDGQVTYSVNVQQNTKPLKVTLVWYDPPAVSGSTTNALMHDLDLLITSPNGINYYGNNLNIPDVLNTNEQILVKTPQLGTWKVIISANALPVSGSQLYSIVITCQGQVA